MASLRDLSNRLKSGQGTPWAAVGGGVVFAVALIAIIAGAKLFMGPERTASAGPLPKVLAPSEMDDAALALQEKGDLAGAEKAFREGLAKSKQLYGDEHFDTVAIMNNLGNLLHVCGNNAEAETLHRQCMAVRERT